MNNLMNDPLGALSKANQTIKAKAKETAESIKNNEELKQKLKNAKSSAASGLSSAGTMAGQAASSVSSKAQNLREKNYHGQLAEGIGAAMTNAQARAYQKYEDYNT